MYTRTAVTRFSGNPEIEARKMSGVQILSHTRYPDIFCLDIKALSSNDLIFGHSIIGLL